jgi:hypothetical protein
MHVPKASANINIGVIAEMACDLDCGLTSSLRLAPVHAQFAVQRNATEGMRQQGILAGEALRCIRIQQQLLISSGAIARQRLGGSWL